MGSRIEDGIRIFNVVVVAAASSSSSSGQSNSSFGGSIAAAATTGLSSSNATDNSSEEVAEGRLKSPDDEDASSLAITLAVFMMVLCVLATAANTILLLAFYRRPALRTNANRFVGNLLVINLLSSCFLIPLICLDVYDSSMPATKHLISSRLSIVLCFVVETTSSFVASASVWGTLLIALDQYLAVLFALRYHHFITYFRCLCLIAISWAGSLMVGALSGITYSTDFSVWCREADDCDVDDVPTERRAHSFFGVGIFVVCYLLPSLLLAVIYGRIYVEAHNNSKRMRKGEYRMLSVAAATGYNVGNMLTYAVTINERLGAGKGGGGGGEVSPSAESCKTPNHDKKMKQSQSYPILQAIKHKLSNAGMFMSRHKDELRTARISMVVVVLVVVCWLPYFLFTLLLRYQFVENSKVWWRGLTYAFIASYSVLSPGVFAYRCKSLQRELRIFFRRRSTGSIHNCYGGIGKSEWAFLQAKHKARLEEQHMARLAARNSSIKTNNVRQEEGKTKSPVRFCIGPSSPKEEKQRCSIDKNEFQLETGNHGQETTMLLLHHSETLPNLALYVREPAAAAAAAAAVVETHVDLKNEMNSKRHRTRSENVSSVARQLPPSQGSKFNGWTRFPRLGKPLMVLSRSNSSSLTEKPATNNKSQTADQLVAPPSLSCPDSSRSVSSDTFQESHVANNHLHHRDACFPMTEKWKATRVEEESGSAASSVANDIMKNPNRKDCHIAFWC